MRVICGIGCVAGLLCALVPPHDLLFDGVIVVTALLLGRVAWCAE